MAAMLRNHLEELRALGLPNRNVEAHVVGSGPPRGPVHCKDSYPCDETDRTDKEASKAPNHQLLDFLLSLKLWFSECLSKEPSSIYAPEEGQAEESQVEVLCAQ